MNKTKLWVYELIYWFQLFGWSKSVLRRKSKKTWDTRASCWVLIIVVLYSTDHTLWLRMSHPRVNAGLMFARKQIAYSTEVLVGDLLSHLDQRTSQEHGTYTLMGASQSPDLLMRHSGTYSDLCSTRASQQTTWSYAFGFGSNPGSSLVDGQALNFSEKQRLSFATESKQKYEWQPIHWGQDGKGSFSSFTWSENDARFPQFLRLQPEFQISVEHFRFE